MPTNEVFVPATISKIQFLDPGELCSVALTLPSEHEVDGKRYPVRDVMRPGNAFLAMPFGARTEKLRRRMYTRSNSTATSKGTLTTIINNTHAERTDTSLWWQTEAAKTMKDQGGTIDVRAGFNKTHTELVLFENSHECKPTNLRLEPDEEWAAMHVVALAFSTGITPFLAHLDYMKAHHFGKTQDRPGAHMTLIVSVKNPRQLMEHEALLDLEHQYPGHFRYYPVLTREWPEDWPYGKQRIIQTEQNSDGKECIDLSRLLTVVPNLQNSHLRMCGGRTVKQQLLQGLEEQQIPHLSFRSEVW